MELIGPTISLNGYRLDMELKNVPIALPNAIRRILLAEIPTVVVRDVEILDNNTKMVHEMLRHRIEMLPINVRPEETGVIRDTKIEVRYLPHPESRLVMSDDFTVNGPRSDVILKDRDLGTPLYFMKLGPNESLHAKASLGVNVRGSQVCVSTFKNHIDLEIARTKKEEYMNKGGDPRVFDSHEIQRAFAVDERGRPNWFDLTVESIGTTPARDLVKKAAEILKGKFIEWAKTDILREDEPGYYRIESNTEGHTLGRLLQEMMYNSTLVDYVAYEMPHPLIQQMILRFSTKFPPENVIDRIGKELVGYCESLMNI